MAAGPIRSLINWHLKHVRDYITHADTIRVPGQKLGTISQCYVRWAEDHLKAAENLIKELELNGDN